MLGSHPPGLGIKLCLIYSTFDEQSQGLVPNGERWIFVVDNDKIWVVQIRFFDMIQSPNNFYEQTKLAILQEIRRQYLALPQSQINQLAHPIRLTFSGHSACRVPEGASFGYLNNIVRQLDEDGAITANEVIRENVIAGFDVGVIQPKFDEAYIDCLKKVETRLRLTQQAATPQPFGAAAVPPVARQVAALKKMVEEGKREERIASLVIKKITGSQTPVQQVSSAKPVLGVAKSKAEVHYDDAKAIITVGEKFCKLPLYKNEHYLCRTMFNKPVGEQVSWDIIHDVMHKGAVEKVQNRKKSTNEKRTVQDTVYAVNARAKSSLGIAEDLFTWRSKGVVRNL